MANKSTNAPAAELSMSQKIDKAIEGIVTRGQSLRTHCHDTLVMVMDHYIGAGNGDTTKIKPLLDAVKNSLGSSLSAAMVQWIALSMPSLTWVKDKQMFAHIKGAKREYKTLERVKQRSKMPGTADAMYFTGEPRDLPFYELEKEANQNPFDLKARIEALIKSAEAEYNKRLKAGDKPTFSHAAIDELAKFAENVSKPEWKFSEAELQDMTEVEVEGVTPEETEAKEGKTGRVGRPRKQESEAAVAHH
jgi:hypothetical protein